MVVDEVRFSEVGPDDIDDLALLFDRHRSTRRCWCTAFCAPARSFALGWVTRTNRRTLSTVAVASDAPVGLLVRVADEPVGWAACGPRRRYTAAIEGRSALLVATDRSEDDDVWLLPCLFVAKEHRGRGLTAGLVDAAVASARRHHARALEAWPSTSPERVDATDFVGRASTFRAAGFVEVARPASGRSLVRLAL